MDPLRYTLTTTDCHIPLGSILDFQLATSFFFQYCAVSQPQCCAVSLPQCCAVSPPKWCALSPPKLFPPTSKYVLCSVPKRLDFKSLFSGKFRKNHMSEDEELPGPQRWIQVPCTLYLLTVLFLLSYCLTINDLRLSSNESQPKKVVVYCCSFFCYCYYFKFSQNWASKSWDIFVVVVSFVLLLLMTMFFLLFYHRKKPSIKS